MLLPWGSHVYQSSWFAGLMRAASSFEQADGEPASRSTASDVPTPGIPRSQACRATPINAACYFAAWPSSRSIAMNWPKIGVAARELQGFCTLCTPKQQCLRDLEWECKTGEPQDWREYCPNAATLNALGALQNCPWAAQYIKMPHASKRSVPNDGEGHG